MPSALDEAQPWLEVSVPAPPWFGSGEAASLSASDLDVAYHGFMSAPAWGLAGRSGGAAEAAAEPYSEAERELFQELSRLAPSYTEQAEGTANSEGTGGTAYERPQTEGVTPETEARGETTANPRVRWTFGSTGLRDRWRRRRTDGGTVGASCGWSGCSA